MGRMEPNLLPRPFVILIFKGRRVIGLPKRQVRDGKDSTERRAEDIYLGDDAVYVAALSTFKDAITIEKFLMTYTVRICSTICLLAIYFDVK